MPGRSCHRVPGRSVRYYSFVILTWQRHSFDLTDLYRFNGEILLNCYFFSSCISSYSSPFDIYLTYYWKVLPIYLYTYKASPLRSCDTCFGRDKLFHTICVTFLIYLLLYWLRCVCEQWCVLVNILCVGWHKSNIIFIELCSCERSQTHNLSRSVTDQPPFCVCHLSASVFIIIIKTRSNYLSESHYRNHFCRVYCVN